MKLPRLDRNSAAQGTLELPPQFHEPLRPDIIRRAVLAVQSRQRQSYGAHPMAGKRASAKLSRRRHDYKGSYGIGISRVPRKILSHRGSRFSWVAAFAPGTVKGRRSHPPKAAKRWEQKINRKENRKAIRSAIAATINRELVTVRGHHLPAGYPFIIDGSIENIGKTGDVVALLSRLGFDAELQRAAVKKVRAGKGKARGRPYKKKKGILIVVGGDCPLLRTARNISGCDVAHVAALNAQLLAPGAMPGRATLWTEHAIERLSKERLFT